MTTLYAAIGRQQRERGGLVVEAVMPDVDRRTFDALARAVGASLAEMGRDSIAGRLLRVTAKGAGAVVHALVTSRAAAEKVVEGVYRGVELAVSLLGNEISEISLVDRPLNKFSRAAPQKIAVIYKRSETEMSAITRAIQNYYGTKQASDAEVDAAWAKMSPNERVMVSIKAALRTPASGGQDLPRWLWQRANSGGGNSLR